MVSSLLVWRYGCSWVGTWTILDALLAGRAAAVAAIAPSRYWIPKLLYAEQQLFEANNLEAPGHQVTVFHIRNSLSNVQIVQCMGNLMKSHEFLMTSKLKNFKYSCICFYDFLWQWKWDEIWKQIGGRRPWPPGAFLQDVPDAGSQTRWKILENPKGWGPWSSS